MNLKNLQNILVEKHKNSPTKKFNKNFSIMVCDDDPDALSLMVKILNKRGIKNIIMCSDT
jgi:hypothetical protein